MSEYILTTENLTKRYSKATVVSGVSLKVKKGSIYGLIGKNGAGKTTILRMIAGLSQPSDGTYTYSGLGSKKEEIFSKVGALIEMPALENSFTAKQNLMLKAIAYGSADNEELDKILDIVGLKDVGEKKVGNFSLGMKQRMGIALALVGNPEFLILDEPINGLDPQGIAAVRNTLVKLNKEMGITILISSHILEELSKIATDYAIIDSGRIIDEATTEELHFRCQDKLVFTCDDATKITPILDKEGYTNYKVQDNNTIYIMGANDKGPEINYKIALAGQMVNSFNVTEADLETYFLNVTSKGGV